MPPSCCNVQKLAPRTSAPVRFAPVSVPMTIRIREVGLAEVRAGQVCVRSGIREVGRCSWHRSAWHPEIRIREVLAGEVHARQVVADAS